MRFDSKGLKLFGCRFGTGGISDLTRGVEVRWRRSRKLDRETPPAPFGRWNAAINVSRTCNSETSDGLAVSNELWSLLVGFRLALQSSRPQGISGSSDTTTGQRRASQDPLMLDSSSIETWQGRCLNRSASAAHGYITVLAKRLFWDSTYRLTLEQSFCTLW